MITLYHLPGAICAHKVRLALAEKQLEWASAIVGDLRDPEYLKLNPSGVVPTLVHGEQVLRESRAISEYIAEAFDGPALMPATPIDRYRARLWSKQVDDSLHLNVFILSFAAVLRHRFTELSAEQLERRLPTEPVKRHITRDLLAQGWQSAWIERAVRRFELLIGDMAAALNRSRWLAGPAYSLADTDLTAYLHRLDELGLAVLWREHPAVADWYYRVRLRPSYRAGITGWLTPADIESYASGAQELRRELAGRLGASEPPA